MGLGALWKFAEVSKRNREGPGCLRGSWETEEPLAAVLGISGHAGYLAKGGRLSTAKTMKPGREKTVEWAESSPLPD